MPISRTTKNRSARAAKATPPVDSRHERAAPVTSSTQAAARKVGAQTASGKRIKRRELSPADSETRRTQLKNLIALGKERSYLTYAEINDHLPDDMLDAEQIETIISMINDMGIQVLRRGAGCRNLADRRKCRAVPDEAAAEAEAALSTVDSRVRPHSPIPCGCTCARWARWSSSRAQREIEIAKRIEDGLRRMIQAISACPTTINEICARRQDRERRAERRRGGRWAGRPAPAGRDPTREMVEGARRGDGGNPMRR